MNRLKSGIAVIAMLLSFGSFAQEDHKIENIEEVRLQKMTDNLDLSEQQQKDIGDMLRANAEKHRNLKENVRAQMKESREGTRLKMKEILTEEQYVKYLESREDRERRNRGMKRDRMREDRHMRGSRNGRKGHKKHKEESPKE